ncbi:MAG: alpha/beta hydrolase family protein [Planctomycetota bacterium]
MPHFVLVHGSGQNASCWARSAERLRAQGHATTAVELAKNAPSLTLEDHAHAIADAVADPDDVVVAHSLSGAFLPLVPALARCRLLVFLAAVIPEPGKSIRDQFTGDTTMFAPDWIAAGARWFDPKEQQGLAREFLFHDCAAEDLPWSLASVEAIDTRTLVTEPCPLADYPEVATAAIVATQDRTLTPDWIRRTSARVLGRAPMEIGSGHCPMNSRPAELAGLLAQLAAR